MLPDTHSTPHRETRIQTQMAHVQTFAGTQMPPHNPAVLLAQAWTDLSPIPILSVSTATQREQALE